MASDPQVMFRAVCWSAAVARELGTIGDASPRDLAVFERQVTTGEWSLWAIVIDDFPAGFLIWSVEHEGDAFSLVINAAVARPVARVDVTAAIIAAFRALAQESGARAVRCWTVREGLRRKLERAGCKTRYVMELEP